MSDCTCMSWLDGLPHSEGCALSDTAPIGVGSAEQSSPLIPLPIDEATS